MTKPLSTRNSTMDVLKLLSAYMVVFIHIKFKGDLGDQIAALARYAVPFFFAVSGYFSVNAKTDKFRRKIVYLLKLFMISSVVYSAFNIYERYKSAGMPSVANYFKLFLKPETYVKLFVFNESVSASHHWFLVALIYVYIIYIAVHKFSISKKILYPLAVVFLAANLYLGEFSLAMGIDRESSIVRNFLLTGFPFFTFGRFVKDKESFFKKVPLPAAFAVMLVGAYLTLFSVNNFGRNELYAGSLFILLGVIVIAVKYPDIKYPSVVTALAGCSTYIYLFHKVIYDIVRLILKHSDIDTKSDMYNSIRPFIACVATTLFALVLVKIVQKIKTAKNS